MLALQIVHLKVCAEEISNQSKHKIGKMFEKFLWLPIFVIGSMVNILFEKFHWWEFHLQLLAIFYKSIAPNHSLLLLLFFNYIMELSKGAKEALPYYFYRNMNVFFTLLSPNVRSEHVDAGKSIHLVGEKKKKVFSISLQDSLFLMEIIIFFSQ